MNAQETQILQDFLNQLAQVRGVNKDPQAEAMISRALAQQPDAAYLLVQRAILLEQALNNAKSRIAQLEGELQTARAGQGTSGSFFDDVASGWGRSATSAPTTHAAPAGSTMPPSHPGYAQPGYTPPPVATASRPGFFGGSGGSFLGNMAATAAGVAGGAFLFQGIENLLGHHGSGFMGHDLLGGQPTENLTVNNFYEGDGQGNTQPRDVADNDSSSDNSFDDVNNIDVDNFDDDTTSI
ncbi:MAG TPA: DUF2076 domain-containing protein [Noviherbaspirillum sp.]|uniref:DUF2076 domain-containing protein n=1 Tax=Noviherbaspirillum sp. TaxID=1926288 RepID=UPI002B46BEC5|nr:DUF2076 domain-containing protein [Noviherbaspirillum sp.]HJV87386.1 DUF2076 domain-containing protein [Noviherbaspirillum sp.]